MTQIVGWPNWIGVVAEDLARQRAFYGDVLGFPELDAGEDWVQFDLGWPVMLEVLQLDPGKPQYDGRRYQVGFATGDIDLSFELLSGRGIEAVTKVEGGGPGSDGAWVYLRDIEGNLFEISQRLGAPRVGVPNTSPPLAGAPVWAGIISRDLEAMTRWVEEAFGFRPLARSEGWAWFDLGWPNLFEVIAHDVHQRQYAQPGWQVAFAVGDIAEAREKLIARGAHALHETAGGPEYAGYWCHFLDAEDNVFAITQRLGPPWPTDQKES